MTPGVRPLVAGNWKMNGLTASLGEIAAMREAVDHGAAGGAELAVCPPATLIAPAAQALKGGAVALGGQDCHALAAAPIPATFRRRCSRTRLRLRHRRPFRAPAVSRRDRRAGRAKAEAARQGRARPPSSASARPAPSVKPAARSRSSERQVKGSLPAGATPATAGRRLRAGLGDRHRPRRRRRPTSLRCTRRSAAAEASFMAKPAPACASSTAAR